MKQPMGYFIEGISNKSCEIPLRTTELYLRSLSKVPLNFVLLQRRLERLKHGGF